MKAESGTHELPLLVLKNSMLLPHLKKKFLVEISSIAAFQKYFARHPLLSVVDEDLMQDLREGRQGAFVTFGKLLNCSLIQGEYYELEIEGLGTGEVIELCPSSPLPLCTIQVCTEIKESDNRLIFKEERLRRMCLEFIKNNVPLAHEQRYWSKTVISTPQMLGFMAMIFLGPEKQQEWLALRDINQRLEFLLEHVPPGRDNTQSKILPLIH